MGKVIRGIAVLVGLFIALGVIGSMTGSRTPSASLSPALGAAATATPTAAAQAAKPAAEKQWTVVKAWTGDGIKDTEQFTVGSEWRVDWDWTPSGSFGGLIQIYIYDAQGQLVNLAANTQKAGADSSFQHRAGTYYLKVSAANGSWKVAVQDRR